MYSLKTLLPLALAALPLLSGLARADDSGIDADCKHNNDAGRWRDSDSPAGRIEALCYEGLRDGSYQEHGLCYQAEVGYMCVEGDLRNGCACAIEAAQEWQSWHGDWFLWSAVTCGDITITIE